MSTKLTTVDEYIQTFEPAQRAVLSRVRRTIRRAARGGGEAMSYGMPNMTYRGRSLIQFGGWKNHVGFYPVRPMDGPLGRRIEPYLTDTATMKMPWDDVDLDLIRDLVTELVRQRDDSTSGGKVAKAPRGKTTKTVGD